MKKIKAAFGIYEIENSKLFEYIPVEFLEVIINNAGYDTKTLLSKWQKLNWVISSDKHGEKNLKEYGDWFESTYKVLIIDHNIRPIYIREVYENLLLLDLKYARRSLDLNKLLISKDKSA